MLQPSEPSESSNRQIVGPPSQSLQIDTESQDSCGRSSSAPISSVSNGLCVKCTQVDWDVTTRQLAQSDEEQRTKDNPRERWIEVGMGSDDFPSLKHWSDTAHAQSSGCPVCTWVIATMEDWRSRNDLFRILCYEDPILKTPEGNWLKPMWISQVYPPLRNRSDSKYKNSSEIGIIHPQFRLVLRLIDAHSIDYDVLRGWLQECVSGHSKHCLPSKIVTAFDMKVLHCRTRKIVDLEGRSSYVALSYLWGSCLDQPSDGAVFPQTIEDALTVSLMLGFEYICKFFRCPNLKEVVPCYYES
jgi:hypothetical protein